jgi:CRISPR/Cas system-associated exonuclease Cas4 (RecB family)
MPHFTPDGRTAIHISDVTAYKTCKRQWNWSSRMRGNLEPKRIYEPFFLGSLVHYALERYYAGETDAQATITAYVAEKRATMESQATLWAEDLMQIDEIETLARGIIRHYLLWEARQKGPFSMENLEFLTLEQEFGVPIWNPETDETHPHAYFEGKWDGLVRRRDTGDLYIWEMKTTRSIPGRVAMLVNDDQATEYMNAARYMFGNQVKGVLYTIMAKRIPPFPKITRDGMLSLDVKQQTLASYIAAIKDFHGDDASTLMRSHYANAIITLSAQEDLYFQRRVITRTDAALKRGMLELWQVATNMIQEIAPYSTPAQHCTYCTFREPCLALQNDQDYEVLLRESYQSRDLAREAVEED